MTHWPPPSMFRTIIVKKGFKTALFKMDQGMATRRERHLIELPATAAAVVIAIVVATTPAAAAPPIGARPTALVTIQMRMSSSHGGGAGTGPFTPTPPPSSPPSLEIGWKVPHHGRRRRPKEIVPDLVEGEKMGFRPMCLYSKCSVF